MRGTASSFRIALAGFTGLALALRLLAAARPLDILDRWFIPDDTYYVLAIARSMAEGLGPTVNGEVLTSGFQPLIAFLLVPVFALTADLELPIRAALVFLGICDAVNVALLGWLVSRWRGPLAGALAAGFWAISPIAIDNALGGLETALALTALLSLTVLWVRHRERLTIRSAVAVGLAIGVALLARVDTVFLVVLLGVIELCGRNRKYLLAIVPTSAAVVAPWWGYCLARFGTVVPDSGAAAREVVHAYQGLFLTPLSETLWATWSILGQPFMELRFVRLALYSLAEDAVALRTLACIVSLVLLLDLFGPTAVRVFRSLGAVERLPFLAFLLHGVAIAAFYAYYVPVLWFFRRYTSPTALVVTALIATGAAWAWSARNRPAGRLALALVGAGCLAALVGTGERLLTDSSIEEDHAVDGATGYRGPTVELLGKLPRGSVVAGLQSGATSYFAPEGITVHNVDGVVDREAARAFREHDVGALLRDRGVTHFLDWELQHDMLLERAGAVPMSLETKAKASIEQQSGHRLWLSEIDYSSVAEGS